MILSLFLSVINGKITQYVCLKNGKIPQSESLKLVKYSSLKYVFLVKYRSLTFFLYFCSGKIIMWYDRQKNFGIHPH